MAQFVSPLAQVSYKREGDDFQLRFSHKFESSEEVFFAFAIPYSYRDTQVCYGVLASRSACT
jgi:hypothetical protein